MDFLSVCARKPRKGCGAGHLRRLRSMVRTSARRRRPAVGIIPSENAGAEEMRAWHVLHGDIREDVSISQEIVEFIQDHGALSVIMTNDIIGSPHPEGIDYHGELSPVCQFLRGRIPFTASTLP